MVVRGGEFNCEVAHIQILVRARLLPTRCGSRRVAPRAGGGAGQQPDGSSFVWLVRHAEKADNGDDPDLTNEGRARADTLANMLADKNIVRVVTSKKKRTVQTAKPLVDKLSTPGIANKIQSTKGAADKVRDTKGNVLLVIHSDWCPA